MSTATNTPAVKPGTQNPLRAMLAALNEKPVVLRTRFAGGPETAYNGMLDYAPGKFGSGLLKTDGVVTVYDMAETPLPVTHDHTVVAPVGAWNGEGQPYRRDGRPVGSLGHRELIVCPERAVVSVEPAGK